MSINYNAYGDVNPIEHEGQWIRKEENGDYDIITLQYNETDEILLLGTVLLDATSSWIDLKAVASYSDSGTTNNEEFALAVVDFYGIVNCGGTIDTYELSEIDQLKNDLKEGYNICL